MAKFTGWVFMPEANSQLGEALAALAAGNATAMRRVYDLTASRIYGKLLKLLPPDRASLALKRTYLRLWQNRGLITYRKGEEFCTIAALAHQCALDFRFSSADGAAPAARNAQVPQSGSGQSAMARLSSMDERDKALLSAAYLEFETPATMARRFGMSEADVRARLAVLACGEGGPADG